MATSAAARAKGLPIRVAQFIEKPPLDVAQQFVASGDYYWNSGMFVFKASRYLSELAAFAPDILEACHGGVRGRQGGFGFRAHRQGRIHKCRSESIDYAVMEKTKDALVLPLDVGLERCRFLVLAVRRVAGG